MLGGHVPNEETDGQSDGTLAGASVKNSAKLPRQDLAKTKDARSFYVARPER